MGLFSKLVMLPLAPVAGVIWIAEQIEEEAEREFYGPDAIRRQLVALQQAADEGAITEEEYLEEEEVLLDRLDDVMARQRAGGDEEGVEYG